MENLEVSTKKKFTMDKFSSQVKVSTSSNVKKVLDVQAKTVISSVESANGFCSVSGKLAVNVIYLSENGAVESSSNFYDFIEKQTSSYELKDAYGLDTNSVESVNFSSSEIILSVAHSVTVIGIYKYELTDISNLPSEFVVKKNEFTALRLACSNDDNFVVAEECETNIKNMTILGATASVASYESVSVVDKVVIDGKLSVEVIYKDEEGVGCVRKEFEFKQEIAAENVVPNMLVSSCLDVRNVTVTPEEKEENTNLVFAFDLYAKSYVFEEETYEAVSDMFSLASDIQTTYDYIEAKNYDTTVEANDVVLTSTNISNIENFDDIIGVFNPKYTLVNVQEEGEKVVVNGLLSAVALYKSGEDVNSLSISSETKFELGKDKAQYVGGTSVSAEISSFKVKAGKELEASFKVNYRADYDTTLSERYIKAYDIGEAKEEASSGIKVYVTKCGETVFDVAKVLNVRPEVIESQNEVQETFEKGQKIYIYSPINLL